MQYHLVLLIFLSLSGGFCRTTVGEVSDPCLYKDCGEDEVCVIEEEDPVCKKKTEEVTDPCIYKDCKEDEVCVIEEEEPVCKGKTVEVSDPCLKDCGEDEICVMEGAEPVCKKKAEEEVTVSDPCLKDCAEDEVCVIEEEEPVCKEKTVEVSDPCLYEECEEDEVCVIEEEDPVCKKKTEEVTVSDPCLKDCAEDEVCVIEEEDTVCKKKTEEEAGPCNPNPCKNKAPCNATEDGITCDCLEGTSGDRCEINELDDTTPESPATTKSVTVSSISTTTTQKSKSDTTTASGNAFQNTTVTEIKPTKTGTEITTVVSLKNLSSTISVDITSKTNHHKDCTGSTPGSSVDNRSEFHKSVKTSLTTSSTIATSSSSEKIHQRTTNGTIIDHFTTAGFTANTTVGDDVVTSGTSSSVIVSNPTTVSPGGSHKLINGTVTDGLMTDKYTTNVNHLFERSSKITPKISSESSTSLRMSESTSEDYLVITSKKSQSTTLGFKSSVTFELTTETLNNTKKEEPDNANNRPKVSPKNAATYASVGTASSVAIVSFAAAGWYVRRIRRRKHIQYYKGCDSSSEISVI